MSAFRRGILVVLVGLLVTTPTLAISADDFVVPLPVGRELSGEELAEATGEFVWILAFMVFAAGGRAVYENWFDEDYGIDKDDGMEIAGTGLAGALAGSAWGGVLAVTALIPK